MDNQQQDASCSTVKSEQDTNVEEQTKTTQQNTQPASSQRKAWFTNERLNLFLALCAIIISAASFYATYLQANAAERQVKAATWPWLEVMTGNFNEEKNYEEITINIKNSGSGPAIIKYVKFFHDEKSYTEIFEVIKDCCFDIYAYQEQLNKLQNESPEINFFEKFGWLYTGVSNNRLLASGAELNLFGFKKTGFNATQWDKVNDQRFNIKTEICYCSLLEQCYLSDGRGDVREIQQCE
ncbi:hypothetical protein [Pseudoalteromonas gelatinilytica]|uniref:Uncharacterized protein n=3 Tax=Pseudoalteromonas TaxID=53246 RepID=A0ABQ1TME0_9GAMM|nr:hypothetical protein [Pseudoalteromonas profundi]GGE98923.1 hypothetical protein GCM10008027_24840 [Pseudoalteromonas profundi]